MIIVKMKKLHENAKMPIQGTPEAAGFDVFALAQEEIWPGDIRKIELGFAVEIPPGYAMEMLPRSGLSLSGITIANSPGLIDCDYRGPICAIVTNHGESLFVVKPGMKIAQVKFVEVPRVVFSIVEELSTTERGEGGFGHTGV